MDLTKHLLPILLILALVSNIHARDYRLNNPQYLSNYKAISLTKEQDIQIKRISDLNTTKKKSLVEIAKIVHQYYTNDFTMYGKRPYKIDTDYIQLIRIGKISGNYFKDGKFVYYCNTFLFINKDDRKPFITSHAILVTLAGDIILPEYKLHNKSE